MSKQKPEQQPASENLPSALKEGLPEIYSRVRDKSDVFVEHVKTSKKILRDSVDILSRRAEKIGEVMELLEAKYDKEEDGTKPFDILAETGTVEQLSNIIDTLGKINKQYFMLNYVPNGDISIGDLIKKGGTENPAGREMGSIVTPKSSKTILAKDIVED
jgi:hypothetical protein